MFTLRHGLVIQAPIGLCFALSTHLSIVERELGMHPVDHPNEQGTLAGVPAGRTGGLVTAGDTVRWEGIKLGFANYHVSLVVPETWNPPHFFQERMIAGRFRSFEHDHSLIETPKGTFLDDCIRFAMPLGWAGDLAGRAILVPYLLGLMRRRFALLKRLAETDEWRDYLPAFLAEPQVSSPHVSRAPAHEGRRPVRIGATVEA